MSLSSLTLHLHLLLLLITIIIGVTQVFTQNVPNCGTKGPSGVPGRIVGGNETVPHEYPWMASFQAFTNRHLAVRHLCGAAIIHPKWALTAAHCSNIFNLPQASLLVGAHKVYDTSEDSQKRVKILQVVVHPDYMATTKDAGAFNDIALLELAEELNLTGQYIAPICVPEQNNETDTMDGQMCTATGWGDTRSGQETGTNELRKVDLEVISLDLCNQLNEPVVPVYANYTNLCTFSKGKDACQGDSGGPLNCKVNGKWYVTGITSWGYGCSQYPGVWTNTAVYSDWIWRTVNETNAKNDN